MLLPHLTHGSAIQEIVDRAGELLVLYHGTKWTSSYDAASIGATDCGLLGKGFYFGSTRRSERLRAQRTVWPRRRRECPARLRGPEQSIRDRASCLLPDDRTVQELHGGTVITASGGNAVAPTCRKRRT
jgi:hypothetical protein